MIMFYRVLLLPLLALSLAGCGQKGPLYLPARAPAAVPAPAPSAGQAGAGQPEKEKNPSGSSATASSPDQH
jgi:predicted small lipoprotein YifL